MGHVLVWKHIDGDSLLGADAPTVVWPPVPALGIRGEGATEKNDLNEGKGMTK